MRTCSISTARCCAAATASTVDSVAWSVQRVTGFEITLAGVPLQGNTDTAILREACRQAGIPAEVLEEQYEAILETMRTCVAERRT